MRLLVLADIDDLHWHHGEGEAEVLVACGDVLDQVVLEAAEAYGCSHVFAVKGNHDPESLFPKPIEPLHLGVKEVEGVRFGGLSGGWKYKPRGTFLFSQEEVCEALAAFPPVDVMVSHNSPRGLHDRDDGVHVGFEGLGDYLLRTAPRFLVHGHQHINKESVLGETRVIGVCGYRVIEV